MKKFLLFILIFFIFCSTIVLGQSIEKEQLKQQVNLINENFDSTLNNYKSTRNIFRSKESLELKQIALERNKLLVILAKEDPKLFLESVFSNSKIDNIPSSIKHLIEKPFFLNASLGIVYVDNFSENFSKKEYYLTFKNSSKKFETLKFFPTDESLLISSSSVSLRGYKINDLLVSDDFKYLDNLSTNSRLSKNFGEQKILVILGNVDSFKFASSSEEVNNLIFENNSFSLQNFYKEDSYNQVSFNGDITPVYNFSSNDSICGFFGIVRIALRTALNDGYNLNNYTNIIIGTPYFNSCFPYAGSASVDYMDISLNSTTSFKLRIFHAPEFTTRTLVHEMGHNFGLVHASDYVCINPNGNPASLSLDCSSREYGDPLSPMGGVGASWHNSAPQRKEIGWLSESNIYTVLEGDYVIFPLDTFASPRTIQMIRIPLKYPTNFYVGKNVFYTIEFKNNDSRGISIRLAYMNDSGGLTLTRTNIINFFPQFSLGFDNYVLPVGKSFIDSFNGYNITLTSISSDGAHITIRKITPNSNPTTALIYFNFDNSIFTSSSSYVIPDIQKSIYGGNVISNSNISNLLASSLQGKGIHFDEKTSPLVFSNFPKSLIMENNAFTFLFFVKLERFPPLSEDPTDEPTIDLLDSGTGIFIFRKKIHFLLPFLSNTTYPVFVNLESSRSLTQNQWHQIALTYNGTTVNLYLDGIMENSTFSTNGFLLKNVSFLYSEKESFKLGATSYNQTIDEFKIYSRALTDEEILNSYTRFFRNPCSLAPVTGPCKAAFTKYYYDTSSNSCKSFIWGGCGVFPFDTLDTCTMQCVNSSQQPVKVNPPVVSNTSVCYWSPDPRVRSDTSQVRAYASQNLYGYPGSTDSRLLCDNGTWYATVDEWSYFKFDANRPWGYKIAIEGTKLGKWTVQNSQWVLAKDIVKPQIPKPLLKSCVWPPEPNVATIGRANSSELLYLSGIAAPYTDARVLCYDGFWYTPLNEWPYFVYENRQTGVIDASKSSWGIRVVQPTETVGGYRVATDSFWKLRWTK